MADPFVAEIRIFGFNFAPTGWALCNGQLLPISQNTALFSLLGTTYGGNGQSNFALPNLQGSAPMHPGQGPGLSDHFLGEQSGSETVTLLQSEIPVHTHSVRESNQQADIQQPTSTTSLARPSGALPYVPGSGMANAAGLRKRRPPFERKGSTPGIRSGRRVERDALPPGVLMTAMYPAGKAPLGKEMTFPTVHGADWHTATRSALVIKTLIGLPARAL